MEPTLCTSPRPAVHAEQRAVFAVRPQLLPPPVASVAVLPGVCSQGGPQTRCVNLEAVPNQGRRRATIKQRHVRIAFQRGRSQNRMGGLIRHCLPPEHRATVSGCCGR